MHQKETLCDFVSETCFVSAPFGEIEPVELVEILAPILWMMCLILNVLIGKVVICVLVIIQHSRFVALCLGAQEGVA